MDDRIQLVISGGRVLDPASGLDTVADVVVADGRVAEVREPSAGRPATTRIEADGHLVLPGLVDVHDHFFHGLGPEPVDPRFDLLPAGVTCAADAGTAGAAHYPALRDLVIRSAPLTLYAWLNIEALGLSAGSLPRAPALALAHVDRAIETIEVNRDTIVGVKVLSPSAGPEAADGVDLVQRAVQAADATDLPVLCHIDGGSDLVQILSTLRSGDIVSHAFHGNEPNILNAAGGVRSEVWAARERGILFDVCPCGGYHMAWRPAEAAAREGFFPDLIGTDFVHLPHPDRSYDITDCMTIMLGLGMALPDVVSAVTATAAAALGKAELHGSLEPGRAADIAILTVDDEPVVYRTKADGNRHFQHRIRSVATVRAGTLAWASPDMSPVRSADEVQRRTDKSGSTS